MADIITIDGYQFKDLRWVEKAHQLINSMSVKRTLAGGAVVYSGQLLAGFPITLEAGDTFGWLSKDQKDRLLDLSKVPAQLHTLSYNGKTFQVIFDFTQGPAVQLTPVQLYTNDTEQDVFVGTIKFLKI